MVGERSGAFFEPMTESLRIRLPSVEPDRSLISVPTTIRVLPIAAWGGDPFLHAKLKLLTHRTETYAYDECPTAGFESPL